jgi:hypothetical protein
MKDVAELATLLADELHLQHTDEELIVKIYLLLAFEAGVSAQREIALRNE